MRRRARRRLVTQDCAPYRLNRGGDRQADAALLRIVLVRMATEPATTYVQRRMKDGLTKLEIMRCLKRHVPAKFSTTAAHHDRLTGSSITSGGFGCHCVHPSWVDVAGLEPSAGTVARYRSG